MSEANGASMTIEPIKEVLAVAKPAPRAAKTFSLVPKDLKEAMEYAKMIAASDLVPKDYKGKDGNCLIGMQFGAELGLPPLQALQNIAVINGKPGVYGDLGKALLLSKGFKIEERDVKDIKAKSEGWCKITRPNGQTTERTFGMEDAKTAKLWGKEGPWTNYPYRMMAWRAFWWAARDAAADVLKGIWGIEELLDYKTDAIDTTAVDANMPQEKPAFDREAAAKAAMPKSEPTPANPVVDVKAPPANGLTPEQRKHIVALMANNKVDASALKKHLSEVYGITDETRPTAYLSQEYYAELCKWIEDPQDEIAFGD